MKKGFFAAGIVCLLLCAFCVYKALPARPAPRPPLVEEATQAVEERSAAPLEDIEESAAEDGYRSPIDFAALEDMNEDIYAWLYVPGTGINHPILQSVRGDNDYYLNHSVDRQEDENGCLFTEYLYSDKEFEIPVTLIYGHRMRSGEMFGQLQALYTEADALEKYNEIIVYTPDRELHYQVFGASSYSDVHIPNHYRRFHEEGSVTAFMGDLKSYRTMTAQFDPAVEINDDDRLVILSTCLIQNESQRFLVLAKLIQVIC